MKYVALCLIVGFLGLMASGYVAFRVASHRAAIVKADPSDFTDLGGYQYMERLRNAFFSTFFLTFGTGVAITLGSMVLILYVKNREYAPP